MQLTLRQSDRLSIFASVAAKLGVEASYVQQIAAGEIQSAEVDAALKQELDELTALLLSRRSYDVTGTNERRRVSEV